MADVLTDLRDLCVDGATPAALSLALTCERSIREIACRYVLDHATPDDWRQLAPTSEPLAGRWLHPETVVEAELYWLVYGLCVAGTGIYHCAMSRRGRLQWLRVANVGPKDRAIPWTSAWPGLRVPRHFERAVREPVSGRWCTHKDQWWATQIAMGGRQLDLLGGA